MVVFTSQLDYLWALLPEAVLTTCALLLLVYDGLANKTSERRAVRAVGWGSLVAIALAAAANLWLTGVEEQGTLGAVAVDDFRIFANFIFLGAAALTVLISFEYVEREGIALAEYYVLLLFAVVGMMLLAASRDMILIFLGFELMSFPASTIVPILFLIVLMGVYPKPFLDRISASAELLAEQVMLVAEATAEGPPQELADVGSASDAAPH